MATKGYRLIDLEAGIFLSQKSFMQIPIRIPFFTYAALTLVSHKGTHIYIIIVRDHKGNLGGKKEKEIK